MIAEIKKSFLQKICFVTRQYSSVSTTIVPFSNIKTKEEIHHKYLYKLWLLNWNKV